MLEIIVILAFTGILMGCIAFDVSIVYALAAGYFIFFFYGLKKGHSAGEMASMSLSGIKAVKNVLVVFLLIGMITALWRAAGTIPVIICYSSRLIRPSAFIFIAFLLNCLVSVLTGTSFGTAATMGVICMSMASAMGVAPLYVGGAVISGIFFGDRCSPVSSSALLVCELTKTDIYGNIKAMVKTALVPFLLTCALYLVLGIFSGGNGAAAGVEEMFSEEFKLHWILILPAALILVLSVFRVNVKKTMAASVLAAAVCCCVFQNLSAGELVRTIVFGYQAKGEVLAPMMNGGGILSMVRVMVVVGLSSSYAGIFERTGLLTSMKRYIAAIGQKITSFGGILFVSAVTSMIACNQTLATMLTYQLCRDLEPDSERMAIHLENSVIVMAPLVPWSIAGAVPVAAIGAPAASLALAAYLYLVPAWNFLTEFGKRQKTVGKRHPA